MADDSKPSPVKRLLAELQDKWDRAIPWHKLPPIFGIVRLIELRTQLRKDNLADTGAGVIASNPAPVPTVSGPLTFRSADGAFNDMETPRMGAVGTRFGRNVPIGQAAPDSANLLSPNPREVSLKLLTRDSFKPASTLNLHAAAWIQFQTHDWFSHGTPPAEQPHEIPLEASDPWPEHPMKIPRSAPDPTRTTGETSPVPTHVNHVTHWWDGSQLYGSDEATVRTLRAGQGGKMRLDGAGLLPVDPQSGMEMGGFTDNWWVGLSVMHRLFCHEHNAICDALAKQYPTWGDDEIFGHARLITAALMAKIHTVEWTCAILAHPTMQVAMNANWWGLESEEIHKLLGRISPNEAISGIPGSEKNHDGVPFSMTEEFVSVYRMHPLMPDELRFVSPGKDQLTVRSLRDVAGRFTRKLVEEIPPADLLYSFGLMNPGALCLHNYPYHLQNLEKIDGTRLDLAATDVLRDRERGVPRYNEFRRLVHMPEVRSFAEITSRPEWAAELSAIYGGDVEKVDLMVGLFAEDLPEGFGFSDTAFRIFILMASRRLRSDRFYTTDYHAGVYTQLGLDWIENNTFKDVVLRHSPELAPAFQGVKNAFAPWATIG